MLKIGKNQVKQGFFACAALAMTGAAHAQSGNVTMYGIVDMGFVHESGAADGSRNKLTSGMMSGSRFGFRGIEDLGGGLNAFFILEGGILVDNGTSGQGGALFGRQALVGMGGGFGKVSLGRQYTTLAMAQVEYDPFSTGMAGTSANMISAGGRGGSNRFDNGVKYNAPTFAGFDTEASYVFGETTNGSQNDQYGASLSYGKGPFRTKVAYANAKDANGIGQDAKQTFLAARYDFGPVVGYINYSINRGAIVPGTPNFKSEDFLVGAMIPFGSGRFVVSYINKNDRTAANFDAQQYAVGYVYSLSKRTSLYTSYAYIHNNASNTSPTGFYRVWNANDIGNATAGNKAFNFGINHQF